ncbi:hypothetical protein BGW80DRAFT_1417929 [Lactifluus volemus]|nr:hypothetical protein BGW80DRAFT_1417929 [Lactifluus volemus]
MTIHHDTTVTTGQCYRCHSTTSSSNLMVVTQQFYSYWCSGFEDSKRVKAFVVIQFLLLALQTAMLWQVAWNFFIIHNGQSRTSQTFAWEPLFQSSSQGVLILSANVFLAIRIHHLANSRLQTWISSSIFYFCSHSRGDQRSDNLGCSSGLVIPAIFTFRHPDSGYICCLARITSHC